MSLIPGSIPVTGLITPTDTTDTYPVTDAIYAIDGLRNVADHTERDNISIDRRRSGMIVGTLNDSKYWRLKSQPWTIGSSSDWDLFLQVGPSGSVVNTGLKYVIELADDIEVPLYTQYWIYGDLTVYGSLTNYGHIVIANGGLIMSGGTFSNFGSISLVSLLSATSSSSNYFLTSSTIAFTQSGSTVSAQVIVGSLTPSHFNTGSNGGATAGYLLSVDPIGSFKWVPETYVPISVSVGTSSIVTVTNNGTLFTSLVENPINGDSNFIQVRSNRTTISSSINSGDNTSGIRLISGNVLIDSIDAALNTNSSVSYSPSQIALESIDNNTGYVSNLYLDSSGVLSLSGNDGTSVDISLRTSGGLVGSSDYSSLYNNLSFVQKIYVDSLSLTQSSFPIIRYIYLVGDISDAIRMGGTYSNIYTTFQSAYDAGNSLQQSLGMSNDVVVQVGNITSTQSGDLVLESNFNGYVKFIGLGINVSELGNIVATSSTGNGYNVGLFSTSLSATFMNMKIGNITTSSTGLTGSSGGVCILGCNLQMGDINTSITNSSNIIGSGGSFRSQFGQNNSIIGGSIVTSAKGLTANAGDIFINSKNTAFANIQGSNNNMSGAISLSGIRIGDLSASYSVNVVSDPNISISDTIISNIQITRNDSIGGLLSMNRCYSPDNSLILITNGTASPFTLNLIDSDIHRLTTNNNVKLVSINSKLKGDGINSTLIGLGDNSTLENTIIDNNGNTTMATIDGIGTGVKFSGCEILDGFRSILNGGTPTSIISIGSFFEKRTESSIKIKTILTDSPTITWDLSKNHVAEVTISGNRNIILINPVEGCKYRLRVTQNGGTYSITPPDGCLSYGSSVPFQLTTSSSNKTDDIFLEFDGDYYISNTLFDVNGNGSYLTETLLYEPFGLNGDAITGFPNQLLPVGWSSSVSSDIIVYGDNDVIPFCDVLNSSGTSFLVFPNSSSGTDSVTTDTMSTYGYKDIKMSFNYYLNSGGSQISLLYSPSGASFSSLTYSLNIDDDQWHSTGWINLPSNVENLTNLKIKFQFIGDSSGLLSAIDDVKILGRP
jgi:hypothetical protein